MQVSIIDLKTGKRIATYDLNLNGFSKQQYFDEAWMCLVEDGLATSNRHKDFMFHLLIQL